MTPRISSTESLQAFDALDVNRNDVLDCEELSTHDPSLDLSSIDHDGDGNVSVEEWLAYRGHIDAPSIARSVLEYGSVQPYLLRRQRYSFDVSTLPVPDSVGALDAILAGIPEEYRQAYFDLTVQALLQRPDLTVETVDVPPKAADCFRAAETEGTRYLQALVNDPDHISLAGLREAIRGLHDLSRDSSIHEDIRAMARHQVQQLQTYLVLSPDQVREELEASGLTWLLRTGPRLEVGDSGPAVEKFIWCLTHIRLPISPSEGEVPDDPSQLATRPLLREEDAGMVWAVTRNGMEWTAPEGGLKITPAILEAVQHLKNFSRLTGLDQQVLGQAIDIENGIIHPGVIRLARELSSDEWWVGTAGSHEGHTKLFLNAIARMVTDPVVATAVTVFGEGREAAPLSPEEKANLLFAQDRSGHLSAFVSNVLILGGVAALPRLAGAVAATARSARVVLQLTRAGVLSTGYTLAYGTAQALQATGRTVLAFLGLDQYAGGVRLLVRGAKQGGMRLLRVGSAATAEISRRLSGWAGRRGIHFAEPVEQQAQAVARKYHLSPSASGSERYRPVAPARTVTQGLGLPQQTREVVDAVDIGGVRVLCYRSIRDYETLYGTDGSPGHYTGSGDVDNLAYIVIGEGGRPRPATTEEIERAFGLSLAPRSELVWRRRVSDIRIGARRQSLWDVQEVHATYWNGIMRTAIDFRFPADLGSMTQAHIRNVLELMPSDLLAKVDHIVWTRGPHHIDDRLGECVNYSPQNKTITIYKSGTPEHRETADTLVHELGHVAENNQREIQARLFLAMRLDGGLSPSLYAGSQWREQFAESFKYYFMMGPERFRTQYPHRAALIEAVLLGEVGALPISVRERIVFASGMAVAASATAIGAWLIARHVND